MGKWGALVGLNFHEPILKYVPRPNFNKQTGQGNRVNLEPAGLVFGEVALVEPSLPRRGSIEASNHRGLKPPGYHEPPRWGEERC